jgi:hypothetical protein
VITKGPNIIPAAKLAIHELNRLNIPYIFVSNACMIESDKAEQLSNWLEVPVSLAERDDRAILHVLRKHLDSIGSNRVGAHADALLEGVSQQARADLRSRCHRRYCANVTTRLVSTCARGPMAAHRSLFLGLASTIRRPSNNFRLTSPN